MFDTLARSWEYAKMSYSILWQHKQLIVFPILSTIAAGIVIASFLVPLWSSGTLETWLDAAAGDEPNPHAKTMYITTFVFYFCNYFVIVFFNTALIACAMKALNGEVPTVGYGLSVAATRLWQIFAWAVVSAVVGVLLRIIENSHKRAGEIVAAIIGMAWTALTFFVVPYIVMDAAGPVKAFKGSLKTLRHTWGTALIGNFSLGLIGFLVALPAILLMVVLVYLARGAPAVVMGAAIAIGAIAIMLAAASASAADAIFKAVLFSYATDRTVPADLDTRDFADAFSPKN